MHQHFEPMRTMADGTIKQVNPFSGTEVWTVPGRGNRPLAVTASNPRPLTDSDRTAACAFCEDNHLQTPPEKARMVRDHAEQWKVLRGLLPAEQKETAAEFRRVANLFEIVTYDYWKANYGYTPLEDVVEWQQRYCDDPEGRRHVLDVVSTKMRFSGSDPAAATPEELLAASTNFFAGGHDLIIGRRHYAEDATDTSQLAGSGSLTVDEHRAFIAFTVDALAERYRLNRYAPYVAVFQNWLKPAGASFDHLHKQLVTIDERSTQAEMEINKLRQNPNMYNELAVDYAGYHNLVIAENDFAVCFAGFGHRYPTLEIYSKSAAAEPWLLSPAERDGMSDLIHACHAAAGSEVPCNEEWHHKPIDLDIPMPWRVVIKWRVSTLAGFEGGTKIYLNTLSPFDVRDRVVREMYTLRTAGRIDQNIRIATECQVERNSLKYNPLLN